MLNLSFTLLSFILDTSYFIPGQIPEVVKLNTTGSLSAPRHKLVQCNIRLICVPIFHC